jgi:hypothetical protein
VKFSVPTPPNQAPTVEFGTPSNTVPTVAGQQDLAARAAIGIAFALVVKDPTTAIAAMSLTSLNTIAASRTLTSSWTITCELLADNEVRLVEEWNGSLVDPDVDPQELITAYARCIAWSLSWLGRTSVRAVTASWA